MIYLDSAAVVKLVRSEIATADLVRWLDARPESPMVSSALVEVEVPRALMRSAPEALADVAAVLGRIYRVEIDAGIRTAAAAYREPTLRSLDAIHLATARFLSDEAAGSFDAFVTYDRRLLAAAEASGLPVESPGQN